MLIIRSGLCFSKNDVQLTDCLISSFDEGVQRPLKRQVEKADTVL